VEAQKRDDFFFGPLPIKGDVNFDHSIRQIEPSAMADDEVAINERKYVRI